jgi:hypothetical protein
LGLCTQFHAYRKCCTAASKLKEAAGCPPWQEEKNAAASGAATKKNLNWEPGAFGAMGVQQGAPEAMLESAAGVGDRAETVNVEVTKFSCQSLEIGVLATKSIHTAKVAQALIVRESRCSNERFVARGYATDCPGARFLMFPLKFFST